MAIRVLLVDDQPVVRSGLRVMLEATGDGEPIVVVGEAADGPAGVVEAARSAPDVVLMDVQMPGGDGLAATREILTARSGTRVLVVTTFDVDEYVHEALLAGASGFVLKDLEPDELRRAVATVHAGQSLLAPSVTTRVVRELVAARRSAPSMPEGRAPTPPPAGGPVAPADGAAATPTGGASATPAGGAAELTPRERDVLALVAGGLSNAEIAASLVLGETTVKTHVAHLLRKLALRDRVQLVVHAYEHGLVPARPT